MKREDVRGTALDLLNDAGLTTLPVDVEGFAGYLGMRVYRKHDLGQQVSGFLHRGPEWDSIVINANHASNRQRFTIAHEIGHWWLDPPGAVPYIDTDLENEAFWEQEREVNAFAAELLMPESHVYKEWERNPDREALCWRFRVSRSAMIRRLHEVGLNGGQSFEP